MSARGADMDLFLRRCARHLRDEIKADDVGARDEQLLPPTQAHPYDVPSVPVLERPTTELNHIALASCDDASEMRRFTLYHSVLYIVR